MAGFAWVTLATNDSYSLGALVLAHSLRRVGSKHDLAVLVTPGVTGAMREKLASVFSLVQEVNVLDSKDEANLALLARPELGITFTKLHCWRLTQYEKCVFVDADTLVIRNCDELFEREELSAAPDVGWPDCFNSGVFVFKPSQQTFASITSFAATKGSFDGGDQGLLNQYFSDWAHKDISKHLPFIYNMCSTATYSYLPAFKQFGEDVRIIHFIGITKPWLQYFDTVTGQVQPAPGSNHLQPLLQLWWHIFCENVHPQLSPVMASSTLASVWHESNARPPKSCPARPRDTSDVIQSIEPDFSEFQDPWDTYEEQTSETRFPVYANVESSDSRRPSSERTDPSHYSPSQSDDRHRRPSTSPQCAVQRQFDSQNRAANSETHREHRHPSVLDDSRDQPRDNSQTHCEPPIERGNFADHRTHVADSQTQNTGRTTCNYNGESNRAEDRQRESQCHHEQNDRHHETHREPDYHREQNRCDDEQKYREQNRCDDEQKHHEQNRCDDEQKHREDVQQEQRNRDRSLEKMHQHHQQEERDHRSCRNHAVDDFAANSRPFDRCKSCDRVENTIDQCSHEDRDERRENEESRLRDRCDVDCREKQTDARTTETRYDDCTTESRSPPEPCSKSQCIATQSEPNIAGQLESNDAGIAGALAKITLGEARSPEQVAFEEHMRKQSWEQGQIDYMGRDSFDNIWKKISETLGVQTQRQPSPPKTVPKPEESKADVATPVATDDQPTAKKSEAAMPAEPREKAEQDLTRDLAPGEAKVAPQIAQLEPEKIIVESAIPAETPIGEAAVTPVALAVIESPVPAAKEPEKSARNDDESPTTTTTLDSTIVRAAEILLRDVQVAEAARTDLPKIPETPAATAAENPPAEQKPADSGKDVKPEENKSTETSSPIVADSQVPIQVAESVLEAEVKESVTEEMRPVTEEAISSISVASQESVPAVLATVMQAAVGPSPPPSASTPNGAAVLDPISEIGNGIDAQNRAAPIASAIVAAAVGPREVVTTVRTEETPPSAAQPTQDVAQEATTPAPISAEIVRETEAKLPASETEELKVSAVEAQEAPAQAPQTSTSSAQSSEKSEAPGTPAEAEKCILIAAEATKKPEEAELPVKSKESSSPPETTAKAEQPISSPAPLVARSDETKVPAKIDEPASPATEKLAEVQPTKSVESACPIKSTSAVVDVKPAATKKQVPKDEPKDPEVTEDLASQSESSEESPVRPARTKDQQQIPGTPIVTEATPPTSPPIGAVETFAEQPTTTTKTTRKVVKKVVKKTTSTEAKATEGPEGAEGEAKKPTKKIVKKVTKKTKEDDGAAGAEASGAAEKPKKIVKVTKKTTKSGPTLEADATTPETPPPGAPEVPVPPKRKLKTAGKSTLAKTEPEP